MSKVCYALTFDDFDHMPSDKPTLNVTFPTKSTLTGITSCKEWRYENGCPLGPRLCRERVVTDVKPAHHGPFQSSTRHEYCATDLSRLFTWPPSRILRLARLSAGVTSESPVASVDSVKGIGW